MQSAPSFAGREYPYVVELEIEGLAVLREGLELAPLIPRLGQTFPDSGTWSVRMRRALVPLDEHDAAELDRLLWEYVLPYSDAVPTYGGIVTNES